MTSVVEKPYPWYPQSENSTGAATSGAAVTKLPRSRVRATVTENWAEWTMPVATRLNEICALPRGWDGYKGIPTRWDTANFAYTMLSQICKPSTPSPDIVPLPSGGLQIEWHTKDGDFQMTVYEPYNVLAWSATTDPDDEGKETPLTNEFSLVLHWFEKLG